MKLKKKLTILFTTLALAPLLLSGYFSYLSQQDALLKRSVEQLVSLADVQEQRVNEILSRYLDQVKLVSSRTQLRVSLKNYTELNTTAELERVEKIIADARNSASLIDDISVLNLEGVVIASTRESIVGEDYSTSPSFTRGTKGDLLHSVIEREGGIFEVLLSGPLVLNNELIGVVEVTATAVPLIGVTEDYSGLGRTGEVILAKRNNAGDAVFLTPLRFDAGAALKRAVSREKTNVPMSDALNGVEGVLLGESTTDYRGQSVIAVTRYIDSLDWGLVVKIDQAEVFESIRKLAFSLFLVIAVSVLAIIVMTYLVARAITLPIEQLTLFARSLEAGNFSLRTEVKSKNEIGFLSRTLNVMAARLEELYKGLEKKVAQRTKELEEADARSKAMLASIGDGLVFVTLGKKIIFVNHATEKLLGWKEKNIIGKDWFSIVQVKDEQGKKIAEDRLPLTQALKSHLITTSSTADSYYYTRKDGSTFPVAITASAVLVKKKPVGVIIVFRDITHERDIDRAKSEFVSLASHQLRTPLSTIGWYAEMLIAGDAGKLSAEQLQYLREIYKGNERMVELVNALLNVSRLELGTFTVEPEDVDIVALVQSVIKEQEPQLKKRQQKLTKNFGEDIPTLVADPKLLRIVFQNLLSNAIKYTPERGSITFAVHKTDKSLTICVQDSGWGIPKEQQDKIFSKLFRADNVKEKDTEGTGLGLYIIKSIVDHSGGTIRFESEENKGTTFFITFPLEGMKKKKGTKSLD